MEVTTEQLRHRIGVAMGKKPADLALRHANVVDVLGCTVREDMTVLISDGCIMAVLPTETDRVDAVVERNCHGKFLLPGLTDAHVHIESTMLVPETFASAVVPCGTVRVVADPHEIANVGGADALRYMFMAAENLPMDIRYALPSCVPCTPFEDAGAALGAADLAPFVDHPSVISLGEVMNVPGVLAGDEDLLEKICLHLRAGKTIDGHSPYLAGTGLQAYACIGVHNDHECTRASEARARVASGMYVFMREGSASRDMKKLLPTVTPYNARRYCLCTDDLHAGEIFAEGHINRIIRRAVAEGLPAPVAVSMATINPAHCFGLQKIGAIAPGYRADLCLTDSLTEFGIEEVYYGGKLVAEDGRLKKLVLPHTVPENLLSSVNTGPLSEEMFRLPLSTDHARVMHVNAGSLITDDQIMRVVRTDGCFDAARNPGLCKIAVIERHKATGKFGLGILDGYVRKGCRLGALATTIAHDSHNVVVAGDSDADMLAAVKALVELHGGIVYVRDGEVIESVSLPVCGLMSTGDPRWIDERRTAIGSAAREVIVEGVNPCMSLSFMSLCVIPDLKLNTRGLFDVQKFSFVSVDPEKD